MGNSSQQKVIVVLGATGGQGSGAVATLLKDTSEQHWFVRAVTRDVHSERAQKLLAEHQTPDGRLSVVQGDMYDPENMRKILDGAYGVFAVWCELKPGQMLEKEEDIAHELEQGRTVIDAAKDCSVEHFVCSSLPDMVKATSGRYTRIHHMDNKYKNEQYARNQLENVTSLIPGFFYSNHQWDQYAQRQPDGVVRFCAPIAGPKLAEWVDSSYDMGRFAARVFALGPETTRGKRYPVISPKISMDEIASTFTAVTGQPAIHSPLSVDEWSDMTSAMLGQAFRVDVAQMMEWSGNLPENKICYGALDPEENRSEEDLGLKASTWKEWLERSGWTGPPAVSS